MRKDKKLLPCPFCGGQAVFHTTTSESSHHFVGFRFEVECSDCGIKIPNNFEVTFSLREETGEINILHDGREKAIEEWNRRTD